MSARAGPRLHVVEHHRAADGPVVVLVHGSLDRGTSFARVVRRLPDVAVVSYDRRGYEHSRPLRPLATTLADHAEDLLAVVDGRPAAVVGHSFGGDVALAAALAAPDVVRAVGVYEPPLPWAPWWPARPRPAPGPVDPGEAAERFFRRMVGADAWDRLPAAARAARRADGPALVADLASLRRPDAALDLGRLRVPVVAACGGRSLPHHRRATAAVAEAAPDAELVEVPGAAHGAHLTHPDAFAGLVRSVLGRVRPR